VSNRVDFLVQIAKVGDKAQTIGQEEGNNAAKAAAKAETTASAINEPPADDNF
jgi:hypothetical protein